MRSLFFPMLILSSYAVADPVIKTTQPISGVSYSKIESSDLDESELKSKSMMATVDVAANVKNVYIKVNQSIMVKSRHTVCFGTFLTTEADYNFTLDVGGKQTNISEHIIIPARQRTCVVKEIYHSMVFPNPGTFSDSASSIGYTMSTGRKQARSGAYIFVN